MQVTHETCPHCGHRDCYSYNTELNIFHCFSCGKSGVLTPRSGNYEEGIDLLKDAYLPESYRGITKATLEKVGAYFTKDGSKETVHWPYPNGTKHRELPKQILCSGKMDKFFGQDDYNVGQRDKITITEGEEDRCSVLQMLSKYDYPVVSLPGATPSKEFWANAQEWLKGWDKIILSVDNDDAGNKLAEKFYRLFPGKIYRVSHSRYKDANEFLVNGSEREFVSSWFNAPRVKPDTILSNFEDFKKLYNDTPNYEYVPTGIKGLDEKIMGLHKGAFTLILAPTGLGKSLAPDTPVLRYNGQVVRADQVQVGDQLMGPDSKPRNVTDVNLQSGPMYRITPVKGEPFECNADHILSLRHTSTGEIKNVVLTDYVKWSKTQKHLWKLWRVGVDFSLASPVQPSFAYAVGAYLGDGRVQGPEICMGKPKESVFQYMIDSGHIVPTRMKFDRGAYYIGFSKDSLLWDYVSNRTGQSEDCLTTRKIPSELKRGHSETRKSVLAGLLDTDGSITGGVAEITQKSEQLADDICFVARSLGLSAYKKSKFVKGQEYFRVNISGDLTGIPCKRLKFKPRKQVKNVLNTGFTVDFIGEGTYRGIALDGDHLFLLGDFTVTHNTEFMRYLEYQILSNSEYSIGICHLEETQLRSVLGLVSYELKDNVTRKDLVEKKGLESEVFEAMSRLTEGERLYQFSIRTDQGAEELVEQIRFLVTAMGVDFIFIEPIQDIVTGNTTEKESRLTDLANILKRLAPEINVGIVVIAHANEEGDPKYCRSIVQSAAFEITLYRDMEAEQEYDRNRMQVTVGRKNRIGGGSGPAGSLIFDKDTFLLEPEEYTVTEIDTHEVGF